VFDENYDGELLNSEFPEKFITFPMEQKMKTNLQPAGLNEIFDTKNENHRPKKFYTKRDVYSNTICVDKNGKTTMLNKNKAVPKLYPIKERLEREASSYKKRSKNNIFKKEEKPKLKRTLSEKEKFGQNPILQNMMKLTFGSEQDIRQEKSKNDMKRKSPIEKLNENSIPKSDFSIQKDPFLSPSLNKNPFPSQYSKENPFPSQNSQEKFYSQNSKENSFYSQNSKENPFPSQYSQRKIHFHLNIQQKSALFKKNVITLKLFVIL
jgi:hypothetical protein